MGERGMGIGGRGVMEARGTMRRGVHRSYIETSNQTTVRLPLFSACVYSNRLSVLFVSPPRPRLSLLLTAIAGS
jgi:hypothetical protein